MSDLTFRNQNNGTRLVSVLGFWSSISAAVLTVSSAVLSFIFMPPEWHGIADYAAKFDTIQMSSFVPVILLIPAVIILMVSFHYYAPPEKRALTLIALAFSCVYAAIISTNYYLQLFVVRLNIQAGDLEGLSLLAMPNLRSSFFALEAIGYSFLSLATLVLAPIFKGSRLSSWIRWLFIANGALGIYGVIVALFDRPMLVFAGLGLWNLVFPWAMILSGIMFRKWGAKSA